MKTPINTGEWLLDNLKAMKNDKTGIFNEFIKLNEEYIKKNKTPMTVEDVKLEFTPIIATSILIDNADKTKLIDSLYDLLSHIYHNLRWREWKKVYTIDPELSKALTYQASTEDLDSPYPFNMFDKLPYDYFVIDPLIEGSNIIGIGVDYENGNPKYLNILYPNESAILKLMVCNYDIFKSSKSINDVLRKVPNGGSPLSELDRKNIVTAFTYLMYIVSVNADICESEKTKQTYRPRKENAPIKDKYSEVQQFDVGVKVGAALAAGKRYISESGDSNTGRKQSPHTRRGHWHTYWVGKHNSIERHTVVKWISPIMVAGYNANMDLCIVSPVDKDNT